MAEPHRHRCLHAAVSSGGKRTDLAHPSGSSAVHLSDKLFWKWGTFSLTAAGRIFFHALIWHDSENKSQSSNKYILADANRHELVALKIWIYVGQSRHDTMLETPPTDITPKNPKRCTRFGCRAQRQNKKRKNFNLSPHVIVSAPPPFVGQKGRLMVNANLIFQSLNCLQLFP